MSALQTKCPKCKGKGHVQTSKRFQKSYAVLKRIQPATLKEFAVAMKLEQDTAHHRLKRMVAGGLVAGEGRYPAKYRTV